MPGAKGNTKSCEAAHIVARDLLHALDARGGRVWQ